MDAEGAPTGLVKDAGSYDLFAYPKETPASLLARSNDVNAYFLSNGITSAQDAYPEEREIEVFSAMAEANNLNVRLTLAQPVIRAKHMDQSGDLDVAGFIEEITALRNRLEPLANLKADGVKVLVDGVIEDPTQTAAMKHHYLHLNVGDDGMTNYSVGRADCPSEATPCSGEDFNYGILELHQPDLESLLVQATEHDFVVHFHAIGDKAVDMALSAIEAAKASHPDIALPHNISHIQVMDPVDVSRFDGVFVTPTYAWIAPGHDYDLTVIPQVDEHQNLNDLDDLYDQDTYYMKSVYPVRSIKEAGGVLATGSDAPVDSASPRPFTNIMYGLLRSDYVGTPGRDKADYTDDDWHWITLNKNQTLDIKDILDAYTINGARALRQDALTGSLEVGKRADLVIINQDIIKAAGDAGAEYPETAYSICEKGTFELAM